MGERKTSSSFQLNNNYKDTKSKQAILARENFQIPRYDFQHHAKLTLLNK